MNATPRGAAAIEPFVARFAPSDVTPVGPAFVEYAADRLPQSLLALYRDHGIGWYGKQELQLVDPAVWTPVLQEWFGVGVASIPFAVTSFGHVYHVQGDGPVQCLDPHFLTNLVVAESADEFFAEHLVGPSSHLADLRGPHQGARTKLGLLGEGELYSFTPMLPLGGTVSPDALTKGDGVQHALLTHRMVREQRQR